MSMKFSWPEKKFSDEVSDFDFKKHFDLPSADDQIFCGRFDRVLNFEYGEDFQIFYFSNFTVKDGVFTIKIHPKAVNYLSFHLSDFGQGLALELIEPVPVPFLSTLNTVVKGSNSSLHYELFVKFGDDIKYLTSIKGRWRDLYEMISSALAAEGFGTFDIKVKVIGEDKPAELAAKLFSRFPETETFKFAVLVIESEHDPVFVYKGKSLPFSSLRNALKGIVRDCAIILKSKPTANVQTLCRRLVGSCFNGGLALELIDFIREEINDESIWRLSSADMRRENGEKRLINVMTIVKESVKVPIHNLKNHVLEGSSEAQFRSNFWDQLICDLFHSFYDYKAPKALNYRLQSEWDTTILFPRMEQRFVDFVALFKFEGYEIPMLSCEMGNADFGVGVNAHKDFSKLIAIISTSCIKLAKLLESNGKLAEDARSFGFWIGGTQIHLVTALPIVTGESGNHQIHINISFQSEWKLDIIKQSTPLPTAISSERTVVQASNVFELCSDVEEVQETKEPVKRGRTAETSEKAEIQEKSCLKDDLDEDCLLNLHSCINYVINHMNHLSSSASNRPSTVPPRTFKCPDEGEGYIPASRASGNPTPKKGRLTISEEAKGPGEYEEHTPTTPSKQILSSSLSVHGDCFSNEGRSFSEYDLYRKYLIHMPHFFPRIYEAYQNPNCPELVDFLSEKMFQFVHFEEGTMTDLIDFSKFEVGLRKYLGFSIHLLNSLDLLHSTFKIIHSDISPTNIMYSVKDDTWKLNDFGQAVESGSSTASMKRSAGTEGYIAPESLSSGIFTEASDVFSLGQVIYDFLYFQLMESSIYENDERSSKLISDFEDVLFSMVVDDPAKRPNARQALLQFFGILLRLGPEAYNPNHPVYIRVAALYKEKLELDEIQSKMKETLITETQTKEQQALETSKLSTRIPSEHGDIMYSVKVESKNIY